MISSDEPVSSVGDGPFGEEEEQESYSESSEPLSDEVDPYD